jgi:phage tail sheath gpL-like
MSISAGIFNQIPAQLRVPGVYIEFDDRLAGNSAFQGRLLVMGQRLATGERDALELERITNTEQAERYYGRGSMLAEMLRHSLNAQPYLETWALPLDDVESGSGGVKSTGKIALAGSASAAGAMVLYLAGYRVRIGVAVADDGDAIAQALVDAINADTRLPVTATVNATVTSEVDLECRWAGETGDDIDIRFAALGEDRIAGVTPTITEMTGGASNPDLVDAIAALGPEQYNWIACPYTDTANLTALKDELDDRFGPMRQIGGRAFAAFRGTHGETGTFGGNHNSPHLTVMGTGKAVSPTWLWCAVNAAVAGQALATDPARPLQTLQLPLILGPKEADRFTDTERNLLLYDGIATFKVANDGTVSIERQITTFQETDSGVPSDSYLDINVAETLERIRYDQRARILQRFPRHKLAEDADADNFGAGQPIVTPNVAKAELLSLYRDFLSRGWAQDYDGYAESLDAAIDTQNPGRLNVIDSPKLVGQYRVHAMQTQFRK